ncbi:MAG: hypothetical protein DRI65_14070, partial [Chloroflexota bacterium]
MDNLEEALSSFDNNYDEGYSSDNLIENFRREAKQPLDKALSVDIKAKQKQKKIYKDKRVPKTIQEFAVNSPTAITAEDISFYYNKKKSQDQSDLLETRQAEDARLSEFRSPAEHMTDLGIATAIRSPLNTAQGYYGAVDQGPSVMNTGNPIVDFAALGATELRDALGLADIDSYTGLSQEFVKKQKQVNELQSEKLQHSYKSRAADIKADDDARAKANEGKDLNILEKGVDYLGQGKDTLLNYGSYPELLVDEGASQVANLVTGGFLAKTLSKGAKKNLNKAEDLATKQKIKGDTDNLKSFNKIVDAQKSGKSEGIINRKLAKSEAVNARNTRLLDKKKAVVKQKQKDVTNIQEKVGIANVAVSEGGAAANEFKAKVLNTDFDTLSLESPVFNEYLHEGMTQEQARRKIAVEGSKELFGRTAAIGGILAKVTGSGKATGKLFEKDGFISKVANTSKSEGLEEAGIGLAGTIASNVTEKKLLDEEKKLDENVVHNTVAGGILGITSGGGTSAAVSAPGAIADTLKGDGIERSTKKDAEISSQITNPTVEEDNVDIDLITNQLTTPAKKTLKKLIKSHEGELSKKQHMTYIAAAGISNEVKDAASKFDSPLDKEKNTYNNLSNSSQYVVDNIAEKIGKKPTEVVADILANTSKKSIVDSVSETVSEGVQKAKDTSTAYGSAKRVEKAISSKDSTAIKDNPDEMVQYLLAKDSLPEKSEDLTGHITNINKELDKHIDTVIADIDNLQKKDIAAGWVPTKGEDSPSVKAEKDKIAKYQEEIKNLKITNAPSQTELHENADKLSDKNISKDDKDSITDVLLGSIETTTLSKEDAQKLLKDGSLSTEQRVELESYITKIKTLAEVHNEVIIKGQNLKSLKEYQENNVTLMDSENQDGVKQNLNKFGMFARKHSDKTNAAIDIFKALKLDPDSVLVKKMIEDFKAKTTSEANPQGIEIHKNSDELINSMISEAIALQAGYRESYYKAKGKYPTELNTEISIPDIADINKLSNQADNTTNTSEDASQNDIDYIETLMGVKDSKGNPLMAGNDTLAKNLQKIIDDPKGQTKALETLIKKVQKVADFNNITLPARPTTEVTETTQSNTTSVNDKVDITLNLSHGIEKVVKGVLLKDSPRYSTQSENIPKLTADLAIHKAVDGDGWVISEASTGLRVSQGKTRREALTNLD